VRNIRFVNIGANFISLVWDVAQESHANAEFTYDVTYYAEDSATENASLVVTRHPNITLDGLLSQTKYAFRASRFLCTTFSGREEKMKSEEKLTNVDNSNPHQCFTVKCCCYAETSVEPRHTHMQYSGMITIYCLI